MGEVIKDIVVVTGAAGFLGKRVVMHAVENGFEVRAVVRPGRSIDHMPWKSHPDIKVIEIDLADETADFSRFVGGRNTSASLAYAVIHTAGIVAGTREQHERINVLPTRRLVQAMNKAGCQKLVHTSSVSIYGYASMPDGSQLDEQTPTEPNLGDRDDYCRAKHRQEQIIMEMAQSGLIQATVLRPGVICGYDQFWTSRLGVKRAGLLMQFNRNGGLPIIYVENCAEAAIRAVKRKEFISDVYIKPGLSGKKCGFEAINIVEDYQPSQDEYIKIMREAGISGYKFRVCVPWTLAKTVINSVSILKEFAPAIYRKIPLLLKKATFHARMKGLRYCNARFHDRLGWDPDEESRGAIIDSWKKQGVKN